MFFTTVLLLLLMVIASCVNACAQLGCDARRSFVSPRSLAIGSAVSVVWQLNGTLNTPLSIDAKGFLYSATRGASSCRERKCCARRPQSQRARFVIRLFTSVSCDTLLGDLPRAYRIDPSSDDPRPDNYAAITQHLKEHDAPGGEVRSHFQVVSGESARA